MFQRWNRPQEIYQNAYDKYWIIHDGDSNRWPILQRYDGDILCEAQNLLKMGQELFSVGIMEKYQNGSRFCIIESPEKAGIIELWTSGNIIYYDTSRELIRIAMDTLPQYGLIKQREMGTEVCVKKEAIEEAQKNNCKVIPCNLRKETTEVELEE